MTTRTSTPRPIWIEIHGRKRRFAEMADARAAANRIFQRHGFIVGIQCDHVGIGGFGYCTACGYRAA